MRAEKNAITADLENKYLKEDSLRKEEEHSEVVKQLKQEFIKYHEIMTKVGSTDLGIYLLLSLCLYFWK